MQDSLSEKIYDATNRGLDIILAYYPQAQGCDRRGKFFKMRGDEKTASACMKQIGGVWRVTDFGDEGTALSPIDICMREERLDFRQALHRLADRYGVTGTLSKSINRPIVEKRPATDKEHEGQFTFELNPKMTSEELAVLGPMVTQEACDKYGYFSVKWYSRVRNRVVVTLKSTENYPIFMRDCGSFRKIYQPLNPDKAYRFFYDGDKPRNYLNGFDQLCAAYEAYQKELEMESAKEAINAEMENRPTPIKVTKSRKLPDAILCSGERDALNVAGMGYLPLWMNSETARLDPKTYAEITKRVEVLYNIPDRDETGVRKGQELAMQYIDIRTVELPDWLCDYKDMRGRPRKDLRDFVELRPSISEFKTLLEQAKPCRFWEKIYGQNKLMWEINTLYLLYFLSVNGFGKIVDPKTGTETFIQVQDFVVKEVHFSTMKDFTIRWAREHNVEHAVQNLLLNSKRFKADTLEQINPITLNFKNNTADSQLLFFENKMLRVTADGVEESKNGSMGTFAWEKTVCRHAFKRMEPAFSTAYDAANNRYTLRINHTHSHYFRFLINASRIFWREEFENRATGDLSKDESYILQYHWSINAPRLSDEEQQEQEQHLLNKIFAIGYLLHSYKSFSRAWGVWVMENKITDEDESSGGSGKTFMLRFLKNFKNMVMVNGRDKELTRNRFSFGRVTENTDLLLIDDADKYLPFGYFFSMITDNMVVEPKNKDSREISFQDSPKVVVTSNYPPSANDGSTARRILNVVFSDYYHKATDDNDYIDSMRIADDFGYELHTPGYKWEWWNEDYNFCVDCLQFYLSTIPHNSILMPPMENVERRMRIQAIGTAFMEWADVFFSQGSPNLNTKLIKAIAKESFDPRGKYSPHMFTKKLRQYCQLCPYIESLNPEEVSGSNGQRIVGHSETGTIEYIYVKTYDTPIPPAFRKEFND